MKEATPAGPYPKPKPSTWLALVRIGRRRYRMAEGPWVKGSGTFDQVDLAFLESMAAPDEQRLLIRLLTSEIRASRNWPTPPRHRGVVVYENRA
jgi:hypothetical protein